MRERARAGHRCLAGLSLLGLFGVVASGPLACGAPVPPEIESVQLSSQGEIDVRFSEPMALHESFRPYSFRLSLAYPAGEQGTALVDLGVLDELGLDSDDPCSGDRSPPTQLPRHAPFAVQSVEQPEEGRFRLIPNYAPADEEIQVCEAIAAHRGDGGQARFVLHYRQLTGADPLRSAQGAPLDEVLRMWPANGTNCDVVDLDYDEIPAEVSIEVCPFDP